MANTKTETYKVTAFKANDYMVWHICTQCQNLGKVILKDDNKTYFVAEKTSSSSHLQHLIQGGAVYTGGANLRLEISIENAQKIDSSVNSYGITTRKGDIVGHGYNYCIEDSDDFDYNDFYIDLVAWNKQG